MARFSGIPSVPPVEIEPQLARILYALKENVELLTNQRGEPDRASVALLSGGITTAQASNTFNGLTAKAVGVEISGVAVPLLSDYVKALQDIQTLAYDVAVLRDTVNTLIAQLRTS
jgi:hypothetical protein